MNTKLTNIAQLIASAIWADGEYDEAEKIAVTEIAEALEFDAAEFNTAIDVEIEKVKALSDEEIGQYVIGAAEGVDEEEAEIVYEAVLQMIISDNVLASAEVSTALAIAEALDIEQETAVLLLADLIKSEPELEIEF